MNERKDKKKDGSGRQEVRKGLRKESRERERIWEERKEGINKRRKQQVQTGDKIKKVKRR